MTIGQPTIEQIDAQIAARNALLSHGYDIGSFIRHHVKFQAPDNTTGRVKRRIHLTAEHPITTDVARDNLPAFQTLHESVTADGVSIDLESTIGCSSVELGALALYLSDIAALEDEI
jgi:hypothetical protein